MGWVTLRGLRFYINQSLSQDQVFELAEKMKYDEITHFILNYCLVPKNRKLKIVFMGSDAIGAHLLKSLYEHRALEVVLVVTGEDKPRGRRMQRQPNPIKALALDLDLPIYQPKKLSTPEGVERLQREGADFFVLMAYGQIVSQAILNLPKMDALNVHTSLLPKYRGASPIQSALLNGDEKTGISLMRMVKEMDAGPVYQQFELGIEDDDTAGALWEKLAKLAATEIPDEVVRIADESLTPVDQDESKATYIRKINKSDGEIDWSEPANLIHRKVRAFSPWPSAFTFFEGRRLKIYKSRVQNSKRNEPIGTVVQEGSLVGVVTGDGVLELMELQLEGKRQQSIQDFLNGNPSFIGAVLG